LIIELVTTATDTGTEQAWVGRLTGSVDPIRLPFLGTDAPINVAQLDDGRFAITWVPVAPFGQFSHAYGDPMLAILDSDLKGFSVTGTSHSDQLVGGSSNDRLYGLDDADLLKGGLGADLLDGGPGVDVADYSASLEGVDVDLTRVGLQFGGHAEGDILVSIESIIGSSYRDNLAGDTGANDIYGGYGNDRLVGGGGPDQVYGEQGDDIIILSGDVVPGSEGGAAGYGGDGADEIHLLGNQEWANGG